MTGAGWLFRLVAPLLCSATVVSQSKDAPLSSIQSSLINRRGVSFSPSRIACTGRLRELIEENIAFLRASTLLSGAGVPTVTDMFRREPKGPAWSRVWALVMLAHWLRSQLHHREQQLSSTDGLMHVSHA